MISSGSTPESLQDIFEQLREQADEVEGSRLSVQTVLDAFHNRAFGPLLIIPALVIVVPVFGAIPTVPTMMGAFVILIATQTLLGWRHPWVPRIIADREISKQRFQRGLKSFQPWARRLDRVCRPRLKFLVEGAMTRVIALLCILVACTIPVLELLPWAAALPGITILCLGLAITARDGLLALIGILTTCGAIAAVVWWWMYLM